MTHLRKTHLRKPHFGPARRALFLDRLGVAHAVSQAAAAAGIERKTAYRHRDRDPEFAAAWDAALRAGQEQGENPMNTPNTPDTPDTPDTTRHRTPFEGAAPEEEGSAQTTEGPAAPLPRNRLQQLLVVSRARLSALQEELWEMRTVLAGAARGGDPDQIRGARARSLELSELIASETLLIGGYDLALASDDVRAAEAEIEDAKGQVEVLSHSAEVARKAHEITSNEHAAAISFRQELIYTLQERQRRRNELAHRLDALVAGKSVPTG